MNLNIPFLNLYSKLPLNFYVKNKPSAPKNPRLIKWNKSHARDLKLDFDTSNPEVKKELNFIFSVSKVHPASLPLSTAYSGHQFGHFSPRLGDGRAHLLGELKGMDKECYELQLKRSGRTAFSKSGDGRSPLGPILREYTHLFFKVSLALENNVS